MSVRELVPRRTQGRAGSPGHVSGLRLGSEVASCTVIFRAAGAAWGAAPAPGSVLCSSWQRGGDRARGAVDSGKRKGGLRPHPGAGPALGNEKEAETRGRCAGRRPRAPRAAVWTVGSGPGAQGGRPASWAGRRARPGRPSGPPEGPGLPAPRAPGPSRREVAQSCCSEPHGWWRRVTVAPAE